MIQKKNLWFLTLFSLILVLSVYYITMPSDILLDSSLKNNTINVGIKETSIIETLKIEDNALVLDKINNYKNTIASKEASDDDTKQGCYGCSKEDRDENIRRLGGAIA